MMLRAVFISLTTFFAVVDAKQAWEVNEEFTRNGVFYGDMMLTPIQSMRYGEDNETAQVRGVSVKETPYNRWDNNIIPFSISPQYTDSQKQILRNSVKRFEQISCFKFKERSNEKDFLYIVPLDGCYSYVGKIGGRQTLSLAPDCIADYIIWHEMMHAIGFEHEHQRPDRDNFIKVEYSNVQQGQLVNFNKLNLKEVDFPDQYDYQSIMHYDSHAFGKVDYNKRIRLATMIPLKKGVDLVDNMKFSATDIAKLNRLGKSPEKQEKTVRGCRDMARNCLSMKQKGMCTMPFFRQTMQANCAATCNMCVNSPIADSVNVPLVEPSTQKVVPTTKQPTVAETKCSDSIPNCARFFNQCTLPQYRTLMVQYCQETCGLCTSSCRDQRTDCASMARNGYCTEEFYKEKSERVCAKTCRLC